MPLKWWNSRNQASRASGSRPRSTTPLLSVAGNSPFGGHVTLQLYDEFLRRVYADGDYRDFSFEQLTWVTLDLPNQGKRRGLLSIHFDDGPIETTAPRFISVDFDKEDAAQFQHMSDEISERIDN